MNMLEIRRRMMLAGGSKWAKEPLIIFDSQFRAGSVSYGTGRNSISGGYLQLSSYRTGDGYCYIDGIDVTAYRTLSVDIRWPYYGGDQGSTGAYVSMPGMTQIKATKNGSKFYTYTADITDIEGIRRITLCGDTSDYEGSYYTNPISFKNLKLLP